MQTVGEPFTPWLEGGGALTVRCCRLPGGAGCAVQGGDPGGRQPRDAGAAAAGLQHAGGAGAPRALGPVPAPALPHHLPLLQVPASRPALCSHGTLINPGPKCQRSARTAVVCGLH